MCLVAVGHTRLSCKVMSVRRARPSVAVLGRKNALPARKDIVAAREGGHDCSHGVVLRGLDGTSIPIPFLNSVNAKLSSSSKYTRPRSVVLNLCVESPWMHPSVIRPCFERLSRVPLANPLRPFADFNHPACIQHCVRLLLSTSEPGSSLS